MSLGRVVQVSVYQLYGMQCERARWVASLDFAWLVARWLSLDFFWTGYFFTLCAAGV